MFWNMTNIFFFDIFILSTHRVRAVVRRSAAEHEVAGLIPGHGDRIAIGAKRKKSANVLRFGCTMKSST